MGVLTWRQSGRGHPGDISVPPSLSESPWPSIQWPSQQRHWRAGVWVQGQPHYSQPSLLWGHQCGGPPTLSEPVT